MHIFLYFVLICLLFMSRAKEKEKKETTEGSNFPLRNGGRIWARDETFVDRAASCKQLKYRNRRKDI